MKPIVIVRKKSDLLPISYICADDGALLAPAADDVVERADEDRVELAPADERGRCAAAPRSRTAPGSGGGRAGRSGGDALGGVIGVASAEDEADEVVEDEDARGAGDDGGVDGAADARARRPWWRGRSGSSRAR